MRSKAKKIILTVSLILFLLMLIPFPTYYKDGGTVTYNAVLYQVTKKHSITDRGGRRGYDIGTRVRVLFFEVYNDVEFVPESELT